MPVAALKLANIVVYGIIAWYLFQITSRRKTEIWFRTKRLIVALVVYLAIVKLLAQQSLPPIEVVFIAVFVGLGASWLLIKVPKRERRIPKRMRQRVIERDLASKGLEWDPAKYNIDHVVPYSRAAIIRCGTFGLSKKKRTYVRAVECPDHRTSLGEADPSVNGLTEPENDSDEPGPKRLSPLIYR
jgi:hypothetical protein